MPADGTVQLAGQGLGIYTLGRELGRGGMGAVYLAESTAEGPAGPSGSVVAVKVFHPHLVEDERAFERFLREAEIGKRIRHPHVVRTYEIASAVVEGADVHYMVMEFIEGQTLQELLADLGTVPEHLLFQIADHALAALETIHARNIVHRDIKPENIVITPDHRVLLMDLGVARLTEHGFTLTEAGEFVGSVAYAAPEQFTRSDEVGPRADIYAFGVVLYELATGKNPFDSSDLATLLGQKLQDEVAAPRSVFADLDPFLDKVIATCVRKEAPERFGSAAELRAILREGEKSEWWIAETGGRAMPSAQRALRRLRLEREAPLVGRRADLARVEEVYHRARGEGAVLLLSGPTGVGKSRLLYEFIEKKASAQGPQIAAGRCVGSGGRSYQPFLEALQDLLEFDAAGAGERRALLEEELLRLLPATPGVVPHFADFVLGGVQPGVESGFSKDALLSAYAGVLRSVAAKRPVLLAIEDLHLAGPESLELFSYLSRCIPGHPILLAGVFAEDEVEEGSALHELVARVAAEPCGEKLSLTPLPAGATEEIVRARVGNERAVRVLAWPLHEKSDGNPLIVLEMLNHLHTTGELVARDGALEFLGSIDKLSVPGTVRDLSNLKLGRLDEEQRETLEAAAVLGFEFEASLLAAVLEEKRIKLLKRLAVLERKHRLLRSSGKDSFRFASHRLFDATYAAISPALQVEYHAVVADTIRERIEAQEGEPEDAQAFALLRHLQEAERTLEAEPFLESAIRYLTEHYHASLAAHFLEQVAEAFAVARPQKRFAIAMKLWACYELLGRRKEQLGVLEQGRELAEELGEPGPLGEVHSRLAVSYWHAGDFAKAEEEGRKGIALAQEAGRRRWESNSLHTLGVIAFRKGEFAEAVKLWNKALNIRREIGDRRGEASSLLGLGEALPFTGEPERAMETKQASLAIFREIGDRRGECGILTNIGNSHADAWELEEALSCYERAVEISRELGDSVTEAFPRRNLGRVYHMLGRTDDAREAFGRALLIFREMGHLPGELEVLTGLGPVLASVGEYEEARLHLEAACALAERLGSKGMQALAEGSLAYVLHRTGKREAAWTHYEKSLALAEETGSQRRRYVALFEMGSAALLENDAPRAVELLKKAWEVAGGGGGADSGLLLCLCRLARACSEAGRAEEAAEHAARAEKILARGVRLTPVDGPEVHYILNQLSSDRDGGRLHLTAASDLIEQRTRAIRNDAHKEYYRTSIWPNPEILEEADRVLGK